MKLPLRVAAILIVAMIASGCSNKVRKPSWFNPGPAGYQRWSASNTDPYPLPDVGPPVMGGRPRGFEQPVNEVERGRQYAGPRTASAAPVYSYPPAQPAYAPAPAYPTTGGAQPYTAAPVYPTR